MSTGKPTSRNSPEGAIFANFISSSSDLEGFAQARATLSVLSRRLRRSRQDLLVECVLYSARNCPEFRMTPEPSVSMDPKELVELIAKRKGFLRQGVLVKSIIYASETVSEYRDVIGSDDLCIRNEMERLKKSGRAADATKQKNL